MSDETTTPSAARTTGLVSFSLAVADLDRARDFYVDVLGFEVRGDREPWPGARMIEVAPPGSAIGLVLLPKGSDIPRAVRMTTDDAETAHRVLRAPARSCTTRRCCTWAICRRCSTSTTPTAMGWSISSAPTTHRDRRYRA